MTPEERERMNALCLQIQEEKNYEKFEELMDELAVLVSAKERRFPQIRRAPAGTAHKILRATATKTLPPIRVGIAETIEIQVADADPLYAEIRVENTFTDEQGNVLALRPPTLLDIELHAPVHRFANRPRSEPNT